jgi:hypothetical protein
MAVDGLADGWFQAEAQGVEPRVEDVAELGGQGREALNARRERISRAIQGTLLWVVLRFVREPLPASNEFARAGVDAVSRHPVGSGPGFPVAPRG